MTATRRDERQAIRAKFSVEHDDGARCGIGLEPDGQRDNGGYPSGFHSWPIERRNAWFAWFNAGYKKKVLPPQKPPAVRIPYPADEIYWSWPEWRQNEWLRWRDAEEKRLNGWRK